MKVAQAYYSTAVEHKEMPGCFMATFATPGEAPMWVNDRDGKPKIFRDAAEAELAGFRVMVARLNRARSVQTFQTNGKSYRQKGGIKVFRAAEERKGEPTIHTVFGKNGK
ncbi:hypothetical protein V1279_002925 [Bradyrhizobium sp. AZCC 1610]|uniref:hypothetical protein n=1 Tax=Bradyrhizobium sp. AZCC 1610 TaxID=3117020 RepID=UPI002FEF5BC3